MTDEEIEKKAKEKYKNICEDIQLICYVLDIIMVGLGLLMLCARWCI